MVELIVTEKPSSAKKIAEALADKKLIQKKSKQSSYYELTHNGKPIIVTSAVGHLYTLVEDKQNSWTYPVFDIHWEESSKTSPSLKYVQDYIDTITMLAKKADSFTVACDYDIEGEVIGYNVIRYCCKKKDASRMKFSTLTKDDLIEAFDQKMNHLDWGQAFAGETRHKLDWFYGINLSRALTASVKAAGSFKVMSSGRVQGPALKILVDREKEIAAFQPEPFWQLNLLGKALKENIDAWHIKDRFFDKKEVDAIHKKIKDEKQTVVKEVKRTKRQQSPPTPFDLTTLQSESYALFKITPKETLDIAQHLYLAGVTSYPRTSSQQLDPKLGFVNILKHLQKQMDYETLAGELLKLKELKPNNGKKTDPAHPAIYPTGLAPKALRPNQHKVYDLIVKRFMATFAEPALRETMEVSLDVKNEAFVTKGTRTLEENWHVFYKPYLKIEEVTLPNLKENDIVTISEIKKIDKETQPPNRFNQSSIIKELEKRNLGTKATRADILDRLFQRGYLEGVQIKVTKLGMETTTILEKYAPPIVDQQLTAEFEEDMEKIREGKEKPEKVLERAKKVLIKLLDDFKKKEKIIGKDILASVRETWDIQNHVGTCPQCGEGRLMLRRGKFGRFIACDKYPECSNTFKIPQNGLVKSTDKLCPHDQYPLVLVIMKGKRPREICIKPDCKSKVSEAEVKVIDKIEHQKKERKCPKCGKALVLRKSFYGEFYGCSGYPACRHTENFDPKTNTFIARPEKPVEEKKEGATSEAVKVVQKTVKKTLKKTVKKKSQK
ncbi:DNA topoisomerase I [Candidatus Woesearchaeota archaeon]|nr:DNA topoisomerase I [Candidatus Woesearchaeota archaeon]